MLVRSVIKPSAYFDSVTLMLAQKEVRQMPGVEDAGAVMGTDANKELLRDAGLLTPEASAARADDLVLVVRANDAQAADAALKAPRSCSSAGHRRVARSIVPRRWLPQFVFRAERTWR